MRTKVALAVAVGGLLVAQGPALAHHAFAAEFDANKVVTLKGTVSRMEWVNPHSWLYVDVKAPDGSVEQWAIECSPPNTLLRAGWNKFSVVKGTEVVVEGYGAKNGTKVANGRTVSLPDGTRLLVGSPGTGAPEK
jgi:hypothetical protein